MAMRVLAAFLLAVPAFAGAEMRVFPVLEPRSPIRFRLDAPREKLFARTTPMRLIYYLPEPAKPSQEDRDTILQQIRLIRDFYRHFGLDVRMESEVYELHGESVAATEYSEGVYDYYFVADLLKEHGLFKPRATIVFSASDQWLGGEYAFTIINNERLERRECPINHAGINPWWCGWPMEARWGGVLHEVGHMLGLPHPDWFTDKRPFRFPPRKECGPQGAEEGGEGCIEEFVYQEAFGGSSVMRAHWDFSRLPQVGLLPHEVQMLKDHLRSGIAIYEPEYGDYEDMDPFGPTLVSGVEWLGERTANPSEEGVEAWQCHSDRYWHSDGRCYAPAGTCNTRGHRRSPDLDPSGCLPERRKTMSCRCPSRS